MDGWIGARVSGWKWLFKPSFVSKFISAPLMKVSYAPSILGWFRFRMTTWRRRKVDAKMAWTIDVYVVERWVASADYAIFTSSCRPRRVPVVNLKLSNDDVIPCITIASHLSRLELMPSLTKLSLKYTMHECRQWVKISFISIKFRQLKIF